MTKAQFIEWAKTCGWEQDRYGHLHKDNLRFKIQALSVRLERSYDRSETPYSNRSKQWIRLRSGYFSNLSIQDGKIVGLAK